MFVIEVAGGVFHFNPDFPQVEEAHLYGNPEINRVEESFLYRIEAFIYPVEDFLYPVRSFIYRNELGIYPKKLSPAVKPAPGKPREAETDTFKEKNL